MNFLQRLGITLPIIQAPMAGVSTPALAAAVSNAGGLGSIAVGAVDAAGARAMIEATAALTPRPFNVNVFVHKDPVPNPDREAEWLATLRPLFAEHDAAPPARLTTIYKSFAQDDAMLALLIETAPRVVSFHFGLPDESRIRALKGAGCLLLSTATNLAEARAAEAAGVDVIVAQGFEAGGHRGVFDPDAPDDQLGTFALTRLLAARCRLPIIAAGGIMDGAGIRAALALGAVAAQLGTAFIACPESSADAAFRQALKGPGAEHTVFTNAISGRAARCLANRFTAWAAESRADPPAYPIAYDAGKALHAAARAKGETGFGAQWAGQGAPLIRELPAASLLARLQEEMESLR
ncbi:nitronate monooxygenase [Hyphomonas sp. WL0036]|uniref:NAD(P)H-dependent flavin oxidoreductase n=1 Tax=Hyphomonas sediminis TaxID=2866160 RepID=UPI001C7FEF7F|nr:nitronate monooxygenase [Hyphomonas sediminis]MBY9065549.1 nitronate monooxygenase [Hyphomonas sediminis]